MPQKSHIQLTQATVPKRRKTTRRPAPRTARNKGSGSASPKSTAKSTSKAVTKPATKSGSLSKLLSPKSVQETLKTVGTLRNSVKNWLGYLQQADQILDTLFVTSSSLKETGVLDKLIKEKGKNLTTDDFTNILIALMNSPIGGQLLKGSGSSDNSNTTNATNT